MKNLLFLVLIIFLNLGNAQIAFQENGTDLGVAASYGVSNLGGGLSFYDFDNDGWDDITFATSENMETLFFKNMGGNFIQVNLGINDAFETKQVLWVDYDNDGDKDFFATSITGLNKFYKNNGDMNFTDVSASIGLFTDNLYTYGAAFGDIDNDGDLDAFITNRDVITQNQRNYLYLNDSGTYVDITESAGLFMGNELSFCASFFDYNNDGFQDIYVSSDKYTKINRLYKNNGDGSFEDVSVLSGAGMAIDAMSTTIDDYNSDGWFDIYVSNTSEGNYHLRNNGDGTFTNVAEQLGTAFYSVAWGAVFLDAENDADLDLYVSGMLDGSDSRLPSAFYENMDGLYSIPQNIGFNNDTRISFANAIGDINNDGFPDIIVMNDTEPNFLWENVTNNANNWIKLKLEGTESNRDGIGSTIEVFSNTKSQYRYTLCGEGYLGQNSNYEVFGLMDATSIDYVKVTWLSGTIDIVENVEVNKTYKLTEGTGTLEELIIEVPYNNDFDNDGVLDNEDLCPDTPDGTTVDITGCEVFSLPTTNYRVITTGESCKSSNNGSVAIEAELTLNYTARLTGASVNQVENFNEAVSFDNLTSGNYTLCITVEGQEGYETCYDLTVTEPDDLTVKTDVNSLNKEVTLILKGGKSYTITLNQTVHYTTASEITLALEQEENQLSVATNKACQGRFEEKIVLSSELLIYPNPSQNGSYTIGSEFKKSLLFLEIYDLQSRRVAIRNISETDATFSLTTLPSGIYIVKISGKGLIKFQKLIKL